MIPDAQAILGKFLREHPDVEAVGARVAGTTPSSTVNPWIKVTQIDAQKAPLSRPEHLLNYLLQFDIYAGEAATQAHTAQAEATQLNATVRAILHDEAPEHSFNDVVVTMVRVTSNPRIPDPDFEPARERYVLDCEVWMHAK